jgi:16S rRNA (adenine1518-N6/adenine1519-N6)-dimethyltransferase
MKIIKKKSLGQYFLKSKSILATIIKAGDLTSDDIVLEIGPGEGSLTEKLLSCARKVIAIEKDHRLIPYLKEKFKKEIDGNRFELLENDILEFDPNSLIVYDRPYKVMANIPYYITGQILRILLESKNQPISMTLLIQKEVAERIVAKEGKESLLSLSVKVFGKPTYIQTVKRGSFSPTPNVDSAILHIGEISKERFAKIHEGNFFELIHIGFAHKRKQLLSNLAQKFKKELLEDAFDLLKLNKKIRAEDMPLDKWLELQKIII